MAQGTLMVDTSLFIDYFRKTDKSRTKLVQLSEQFDHLAMASVTEFELYSGATPAQLPFWNDLLQEILIVPFDSRAAHLAVDIQQALKKHRYSRSVYCCNSRRQRSSVSDAQQKAF